MTLTAGDKAPNFTLPRPTGEAFRSRTSSAPDGRPVLLPEGRHPRLHRRSVHLPRQLRGLRRGGRRGRWRQLGLRGFARPFRQQAQAADDPPDGRGRQGASPSTASRPTLGFPPRPGRRSRSIGSGTIVHTFASQLRIKTHVEQALAVVKGLEHPDAVPCDRRRSTIGFVARTFVVGDIHGDLEGLERVFDRLPTFESGDTIVFVGDYIDCGPKSRAGHRVRSKAREERPGEGRRASGQP